MAFSARALAMLVACTAAYCQPQEIITFGDNAANWNSLLGLTAVRIGCSQLPAACVGRVDDVATSQKVRRVYLAIVLRGTNLPETAKTYSALSLSHPALYEVGRRLRSRASSSTLHRSIPTFVSA
jgi:hypothetical protein